MSEQILTANSTGKGIPTPRKANTGVHQPHVPKKICFATNPDWIVYHHVWVHGERCYQMLYRNGKRLVLHGTTIVLQPGGAPVDTSWGTNQSIYRSIRHIPYTRIIGFMSTNSANIHQLSWCWLSASVISLIIIIQLWLRWINHD